MNWKRIYKIFVYTIVVIAYGVIAFKLATYNDYSSLFKQFTSNFSTNWFFLLACLMLMPCNMFMAPEIDEIVKNEECADMFDILIVNALGYKCPICESTIDSAMSFIIGKCHNEINTSNYDDNEKHHECQQCTEFYTQASNDLKRHFDSSGLLYKC